VLSQRTTGEVSARVGNGREYTTTWTDDTQTTVPFNLMIGAFTASRRLDPGDHVLAPHGDEFSLGTVVSRLSKNGKLTVRFTDGSAWYDTLRCVRSTFCVTVVVTFVVET